MTVYIILWIYTVALMFFLKQVRLHPKYFLIMSFTGMAILLGFRGAGVGEDTRMYLRIAESAAAKSWSEILSGFPTVEWNYISYGMIGGYSEQTETLYMIYNKVIMSVFHDPQWVLIVTAILTSIFMGKFILDNVEKKEDIYMATYIYMCDAFFMNSFNTMRQIFAISIAVQSLATIKEGNLKKAIAIVLFAACIHQSSILFIVVLLLYRIKNKQRFYKYLVGGVCAVPFIIPVAIEIVSLITPRYRLYLQESYWAAQARGTLMLWAIIIAMIIMFIRTKKTENFDWWLVYLATLYIEVEIIGLRLTVISRAALYFRIGLLLFFPAAEKYFEGKSRWIYRIAMIFIVTFSYFSYANSPARVYEFF